MGKLVGHIFADNIEWLTIGHSTLSMDWIKGPSQGERTLLGGPEYEISKILTNRTGQLLNKPYVNEGTLRGQKQPLKCC